eukprot:SAG31_NODE_517_length_14689_cov_5.110487_8_plen_119_part_00
MAVSRSLGDFGFKGNKWLPPEEQKVSPQPELRIVTRDANVDELVILACDGVWDVMNNRMCYDTTRELLDVVGREDMAQVSEKLLQHCLERGSTDNLTSIVIVSPAIAPRTIEQSHSDR